MAKEYDSTLMLVKPKIDLANTIPATCLENHHTGEEQVTYRQMASTEFDDPTLYKDHEFSTIEP